MEVGDRINAVLSGERPDKIPWTIYSMLLPRGNFERKMRDMGLGIVNDCSLYKASMPNVRVETRTEGNYAYTTYHTPIGKVSMKIRTGLKFQSPGGSAIVEHPIKSIEDIKVLKYIIEDSIYEPDYDSYRQLEDELGSDGVIMSGIGYTPLMEMIINQMGFKTFAMMSIRHPEAIEDLVEALGKKQVELLKIIADSPVKIVSLGDNIDGVFVSPSLFEKYCLPYYNKYAELLKERGKVVMSHMDGRLRVLRKLIAMTKLDVIEAFTPPPMGDLPLREAKEEWKDKIIWINFPEEIFLRSEEEIRSFTIKLLEEIAPGDGFILGITEDINPDHFRKGMETVTETIYKYGDLPIKPALRG
ncbi:MAG: uroporphyrinogen decarboxylase family protein [Thermoproteota archaeon]